jgi:hypothetical protein
MYKIRRRIVAGGVLFEHWNRPRLGTRDALWKRQGTPVSRGPGTGRDPLRVRQGLLGNLYPGVQMSSKPACFSVHGRERC